MTWLRHQHGSTHCYRMDLVRQRLDLVILTELSFASQLTLHFLSISHILPPNHAHSVVYENNWEYTVRCDDIKFLNCLICNGRDASI